MLATFRSMSQGILAKILMGFLVLSFGVWGIGDIFQSGSEQAVAMVEGESISVNELNALVERLERNYPEITPDMTSDPAFRIEVLNNIINERLMRLEAASLGLSFSQDAMAKITARNPLFQKPGGGFDRNLFLLTLQQNNHSEQSYLARLQDELGASLIQDTFKLGMVPSDNMAKLYYQIRNEKRKARLVLIAPADAEKVATPKEDELKSLYERDAERYMEPERRSLRSVRFAADHAWEILKLNPSDQELQSLYNERKGDFAKGEQRDIAQLLFSSEEKAKGVAALISSGTSFKDAAKDDRVMNENSTAVGLVTRESLPEEVAGTVFSLPEKGISAPVESSFGWHIFAVNSIVPPSTPAFEDLRDKLVQVYRTETAESRISELGNQLEDALAGGASFEDALKQIGLGELGVETLGPISAINLLPDGSVKRLDKTQQEMLRIGFELDEEGATSSLVLTPDSDYVLVQVAAITPASPKPFESVRAQVLKSYLDGANASALKKKAEAVAKRLGEAENADAALKADGIRTFDSGQLTRLDDTVSNQGALKNKILTSGFTAELFRLKKGRVTGAYPLPSGEYVIGILDEIVPATAPSAKDMDALRSELQTLLPEEALQLMLAYLRVKYDVSINDEQLFAAQDSGE